MRFITNGLYQQHHFGMVPRLGHQVHFFVITPMKLKNLEKLQGLVQSPYLKVNGRASNNLAKAR